MNIQNFGYTEGAAVNVNVPDIAITATVEADGGAVLADYTGPNALHFPAVLSTMTVEQRAELLSQIAQTIVLIKAGLA
jgi:hypothetical protein